jgi:hypothetical protein
MYLALLCGLVGGFDRLALWQLLVKDVALVGILMFGGAAGVAQW